MRCFIITIAAASSASGTNRSIIHKDFSNGYRARINTGDQLEFIASGSNIDYQTNLSVTLDTWIQLTVSHDSSGGSMYFNGILITTNNVVANSSSKPFGVVTSNTNNMIIGRLLASLATEYFVGNISIIRIYNRGLSSSEITQNFNFNRNNSNNNNEKKHRLNLKIINF